MSKLRLEKLNAQYPKGDVVKLDEFRNRFVIADTSKVNVKSICLALIRDLIHRFQDKIDEIGGGWDAA